MACAFFITILLCSTIGTISSYPRPVFFLLFSLFVAAGVLLGVTTGYLILEKRLSLRTNTFILSLVVGMGTSVVITSYMFLRENLRSQIARLKDVEIENERLKRIETEARLNSLQSKLNPHFLFNTLNSTAALVYDDPAKAEESIVRLSGLYQKVLSISNQTMICLSEEIELIEDYLELEKLRFDEQLTYAIHCPAALEKRKIPGLLIEPLVENVVKHAQSHADRPIAIDIDIQEKHNGLVITVKDNGPGFEVHKSTYGFGLFSIQERLRLMYKDDYDFDIKTGQGQGTEVIIRVPARENFS
jgi:LytS/YehU family sensor histidine kinase